MQINVPIEYKKMNSLPEDPVNSISYGKQTQSSDCFMMIYPIDKQKSMPYENVQAVIDGIHGVLDETQGLIEVKSGMTKNFRKYIYSIIKTKMNPSGMQYILTMHVDADECCMKIQSFCSEKGMTGFRDSSVMNMMVKEGKVTLPDMSGWFKDPYDENYKRGIVMNLSEREEYDPAFLQHPLSEARNLVKYIVENN